MMPFDQVIQRDAPSKAPLRVNWGVLGVVGLCMGRPVAAEIADEIDANCQKFAVHAYSDATDVIFEKRTARLHGTTVILNASRKDALGQAVTGYISCVFIKHPSGELIFENIAWNGKTRVPQPTDEAGLLPIARQILEYVDVVHPDMSIDQQKAYFRRWTEASIDAIK